MIDDYVFPLCSKCKSQLVIGDYYIDKQYYCEHKKELGMNCKYNCKCGAWGDYTDIMKDTNCDLCDRKKYLKKSSIQPHKDYKEFCVYDLNCKGHYCMVEYCDFKCYDCGVKECCCYGVYHCCCEPLVQE
jgi:hypothetical protein